MKMGQEIGILLEIYLAAFQYAYAVFSSTDSRLRQYRRFTPILKGNVNLEVTSKKTTETTFKVFMYTAWSGGLRIGKYFDAQMLSSDY